MLKWFDTGETEKFARALARDIMDRLPCAALGEYKRGNATRHAKSLQFLHARADRFRAEHALNFYKTAKLGNVLKWELKEAGYPEEFVDQITQDIVVRLTVARSG